MIARLLAWIKAETALATAETWAPAAYQPCSSEDPRCAETLAVWGKFHKARKGGHEPGERPYEPDDEAGFEVEAIMLGETDVTAELGEAGEEAVAGYVMENCEE